MKTATQTSPDHELLCKLITPMSVGMMTYLDAAGVLVSKPMSPLEIDDQGALWFFTERHSEKMEHLKMLNLSFADPSSATYVSMSGHGEMHIDKAHIEDLWSPLFRIWFAEGIESDRLSLLKFVPDCAEYWDALDSPTLRLFTTAASVIAAKPLGQGRHAFLKGLSRNVPNTLSS